MSTKQVLFLCTGNSCRSQMAEGLVNYFMSDEWEAFSRYRSKSADEFRYIGPDLVITVCDEAAENCPVWLGQGQVAHLSFPDPAKATGTEEERLAVFRQVRDDIRRRVLEYLATVEITSSSAAV
jgi:arsenate reductase